jgi:hypothetical protein
MKCTFHGSLRHPLRGIVQRGCVRVRHAPPWNITVSSYVWANRIILSFLSELSQVLCSDGGRVTPSAWAYFLRRRESYSLHSGIFPHLYPKKRTIIITYVDDCIIVSDSIKDINTFVKSMKDCPKGYVLIDEGDINKFIGIEIKGIAKNKFELSQPFLIVRICNVLGMRPHEFNVQSNTKVTPVGKPLLNKDLEAKPCKKDWEYCTVIGILNIL